MNSHYEKFLATGEVKCIDDEIPFEIPEGWEWCRFSHIYWQLTDGTHSTPKYTDSGVPFISVKDISSGYISFDNTKYISEKEHRILSQRCNPRKGDLLLSKVGTTGIPVIVDTEREFSLFVSVALIKFFDNYILPDYLICLINSPLVQEQVKINTRGVGNKNWVLSAISNTLMVIPPLTEQYRITNKFKLLKPFTTQYEKQYSRLEALNIDIWGRLKKSILQEAIQGKLVPQDPNDEPASVLLERIREEKQKLVIEGKLKKKDVTDSVIFKGEDNKYFEKIGKEVTCIDDEIPFEIPFLWEWVRLGYLIRLISGTSYQKGDVTTSGIRVLRGGNVLNNELYLADDDVFLPLSYKDEDKNIQKGDVIIVASTGSTAVIGKPAIIRTDMPDTQIGAFLRIIRPVSDLISSYIHLIMTSEYYRAHIRDKSKGTNINNIKAEYIEDLLIPLPPIREQERIVSKIEELYKSLE